MCQAIARAIAPPPVGTVKNWAVYRSRFIDPIRIRAGVKFWQDNREAALERAEQQMGVPAEPSSWASWAWKPFTASRPAPTG
jgi:membrane-bound lytic murein transglycosylase B